MIFWIVAFWFVLAEGVFFYLILRFRKKEGVPGQYITGELKSEKRWITIPHFAVLVFDVFILFFAVKVWYEVKQNIPDVAGQGDRPRDRAAVGLDLRARRSRRNARHARRHRDA